MKEVSDIEMQESTTAAPVEAGLRHYTVVVNLVDQKYGSLEWRTTTDVVSLGFHDGVLVLSLEDGQERYWSMANCIEWSVKEQEAGTPQ